MLSLVGTKTVPHKRNKSTRDTYVINNHLADATEDAVSKADKTIDADNVKLVIDDKYKP